jgi:methyltransferase family protein
MTSDRLTEDDRKHWHPLPSFFEWLAKQIPAKARVLDVGAGILPFPRANVLVDAADPDALPGQEVVKCDFARNPLPFPDKSFDFVYCRHVLEDMHDPFSLCREMERVGKAGYIETPSPLAEMCRGVDGTSPPWRGYYHHHWIIWEYEGELRFVTKYPITEYVNFEGCNLADKLRASPIYWNTHLLWKERIKISHRQTPVDFHIMKDYGPMLASAIDQTIVSCDVFWHEIPRELRIPQIGLNQVSAA